jgi:hypothetical protein
VALPFFVGRSLGLARMPMMFMFGGGPGFMPAFGGFGLLGGLFLFGRFIFPLLLIVLAVFGLVSLLRGGQSIRPQPAAPMAAASVAAPASPAASTDVMPASSVPVEQAAPAATIPCAHCGSPLQTGWVACPYCGEKV